MGGLHTATEGDWLRDLTPCDLGPYRDDLNDIQDTYYAIDGNGREIMQYDHHQYEVDVSRPQNRPELRLRGPVLDYFRSRGWQVVFNPDGSDFFDALCVRFPSPKAASKGGTVSAPESDLQSIYKKAEVMVLELKVGGGQGAFGQAVDRKSWADYVAVVRASHRGARRTAERLRNGGFDMGFEYKGSSKITYDGVGIYAVRDGTLVQVRRPTKNRAPSEHHHTAALRWMKLYRIDRAFARHIGSTYLRWVNFKTTHGIPKAFIDAVAEGRVPRSALASQHLKIPPANQHLLDDFSG